MMVLVTRQGPSGPELLLATGGASPRPSTARSPVSVESSEGADDADTIGATGDLVYVLQQLGRVSEAEPLARASMEHSRRVLDEDSPQALIATNELAFLLLGERRFAEAEPLFKASLEGHRRLRGRDHPDTLILVGNMAGLYAEQKRWSEAEPYDREAYDGFVRTLGPDHQYSIQLESNLAVVLDNSGKTEEAERLHRSAWQRARRVFGPTGSLTLRCLLKWSQGLVQRGEFARAEPPLTETAAAMRQDAHANPSDEAGLLTRIAQVRLGLRQYASAEAALIEADRLRPDGDKETPSGAETRVTFARLYDAWEKAEPGRYAEQLARWRAAADARHVAATKGVK